jgi:hypothetical protein
MEQAIMGSHLPPPPAYSSLSHSQLPSCVVPNFDRITHRGSGDTTNGHGDLVRPEDDDQFSDVSSVRGEHQTHNIDRTANEDDGDDEDEDEGASLTFNGSTTVQGSNNTLHIAPPDVTKMAVLIMNVLNAKLPPSDTLSAKQASQPLHVRPTFTRAEARPRKITVNVQCGVNVVGHHNAVSVAPNVAPAIRQRLAARGIANAQASAANTMLNVAAPYTLSRGSSEGSGPASTRINSGDKRKQDNDNDNDGDDNDAPKKARMMVDVE